MTSRRKITAVDVARRAGVSQPTVSRVFTPGGKVSQEMAIKVRQAAEELGYRPNTLARSLITGRSRTIGLVVAYFDNPFYSEALERLSLSLRERGYHITILMAANRAQDVDGVIEELMDRQVDGIILASVSISSSLSARLKTAGRPVILFNRGQDAPDLSYVTSANIAGGRRVADYLIAGGHHRIAHIAGWQGASTGRDRQAGFEAGLAAAGQRAHAVLPGEFSRDKAMAATRELMAGPTPPDAIFAGNDHMAFGVLDVLRHELGLSVPGDVSVVGYDDVAVAGWPGYDLTTLRQPAARMVEATISQLLTQIEDERAPPRQIEIDGPLIERGSARLPERWAR